MGDMQQDTSSGKPVKESIIMTVYDREPEVLLNTFRWLSLSDLSESEIIVIDDCSTMTYEWLGPYLKELPTRWLRMEPYECCKIDGNYNNPAKAFNQALLEARGERVAIMSSDVIVPPRVLEAARKAYDGDTVWCPMVIDLATSMEYCGPHRQFPMPWFLYAPRQLCVDAGGWDENYLLGMCFEDNDFVGRLALECRGIQFDWNQVVWHQSHFQPAYQDADWVQIANASNKKYTIQKWKGIPFDSKDMMTFQIDKTRNEKNGALMWVFTDYRGVKDEVKAKTLSPFIEQTRTVEA